MRYRPEVAGGWSEANGVWFRFGGARTSALSHPTRTFSKGETFPTAAVVVAGNSEILRQETKIRDLVFAATAMLVATHLPAFFAALGKAFGRVSRCMSPFERQHRRRLKRRLSADQ